MLTTYELKKLAQQHTKEMESLYSKEINHSIQNTKIYSTDWRIEECDEKECFILPSMTMLDTDSVSALFKISKNNKDKKICILNFADNYSPGGLFLEGIIAQEEDLCHESFLYNVLASYRDTYYAWNSKHSNNELYENRALYSPDILFIDENNDTKAFADVLTCAAPNRSFNIATEEENYSALYSRIKFLLEIIKENKVDIAILGAFGCGVFFQDPKDVASFFKELIPQIFCDDTTKFIFSIPDKNSRNYQVFSNIIAS